MDIYIKDISVVHGETWGLCLYGDHTFTESGRYDKMIFENAPWKKTSERLGVALALRATRCLVASKYPPESRSSMSPQMTTSESRTPPTALQRPRRSRNSSPGELCHMSVMSS